MKDVFNHIVIRTNKVLAEAFRREYIVLVNRFVGKDVSVFHYRHASLYINFVVIILSFCAIFVLHSLNHVSIENEKNISNFFISLSY